MGLLTKVPDTEDRLFLKIPDSLAKQHSSAEVFQKVKSIAGAFGLDSRSTGEHVFNGNGKHSLGGGISRGIELVSKTGTSVATIKSVSGGNATWTGDFVLYEYYVIEIKKAFDKHDELLQSLSEIFKELE